MEGKYQAYPTYKDSGVEWLGEVPVDWNGSPIKLLVKTRKGVAFKSTDFSDKGIRVVKASDIKELTIRSSDVYLSKIFKDTYPKAVLSEGDIVISTVGSNPDVKNSAVGQIGIVPSKLDGTLLNQNTVVFDPDINKISKFYFSYVLQMTGYRDHLDLHAHGTANQSSLSISDMLEFRTPLPSVIEQQQIANFLDHETAKIDTLIDKQQQLITLLKEKRQAVISHAVTKGLNPNAPMRDSGVEWLGEVPAHWDVCMIKHKCLEITDGAHVSPETEGGERYFVSITDIKKGVINFNDALLTTPESYGYLVKTGCMPFTGDILFSKDGTIGQTAITPEGIDFVVASSLIIIRPNRMKVTPEYLNLLLQSGVVAEQVESFVKGAALRRLSIQNLLKIGGAFPPIIEQIEITKKLTNKLSQYDDLELKARSLIALQAERRTALISAAVTGKIDVRNWKAQDMENIT
jgi:type I restriction enzyme S subunit